MGRILSYHNCYYISGMSVDFINDDFGLYFATNYLKAHLRTLRIVDILIQDLKLDSIFDIEERKDDCDCVTRGKFFADVLERRTHFWPYNILRLLLNANPLLRYHQRLHLLNS